MYPTSPGATRKGSVWIRFPQVLHEQENGIARPTKTAQQPENRDVADIEQPMDDAGASKQNQYPGCHSRLEPQPGSSDRENCHNTSREKIPLNREMNARTCPDNYP